MLGTDARTRDAVAQCEEHTGLAFGEGEGEGEGAGGADASWFGACVASRLADLGVRYLGRGASDWPACPPGSTLDWRARACSPTHRFVHALRCPPPALAPAPGLCPAPPPGLAGAAPALAIAAVGAGALVFALLALVACRATAGMREADPLGPTPALAALRRGVGVRLRAPPARIPAPPFLGGFE